MCVIDAAFQTKLRGAPLIYKTALRFFGIADLPRYEIFSFTSNKKKRCSGL